MPGQSNNTTAQKWYAVGQGEHDKFVCKWREAKGHAFNAGFAFLKARSEIHHGDWGLFLETRERAMKPRTVTFYMQLADAALAWAKAQFPEMPDAKLAGKAKEVMMQSPKPLVALLRELRELRPFGEYDSVRYAQRKLVTGQQLEMNFSAVVRTFDLLDHIGEANFTLTLPEGKTEDEALDELAVKLAHIIERIRARKVTIDV